MEKLPIRIIFTTFLILFFHVTSLCQDFLQVTLLRVDSVENEYLIMGEECESKISFIIVLEKSRVACSYLGNMRQNDAYSFVGELLKLDFVTHIPDNLVTYRGNACFERGEYVKVFFAKSFFED